MLREKTNVVTPARQGTRASLAALAAAALLCFATFCDAAVQPFQVSGPGVNPADFRITTFATGLDFPYGMLQLSDGSLLVATRTSTNDDFFSAPSKLLRLTDTNHDGIADGPGTVLYSGLPTRATSLAQTGNLILVTTASDTAASVTILRQGVSPAAPLTSAASIDLTFGGSGHPYHQVHALALRDTPAQPGSHDVFFNIGSAQNDTATALGDVTFSGIVSGTGNSDSIYKVTFTDGAGGITGSGLTQIASGLRNAAGIAFHPTTGDLYFQDNGIDGPGDNGNEPTSVDELNRIAAADIGGAVENFGFPGNYIQYRTGTEIGSGGVDPIATFQPIPNPTNGSESEGAAQITFAPSLFPASLRNGMFIGFHGKFVLAGIANEENPLVWVDPATGNYFHFVDNSQPVGHLDGLLATADSLFLADFSANGFDSTSGAIYQISVVPEPASGSILIALAALALRRRARAL